MAKFISIIIVVALCFSLCFCSRDGMPRYSENFDRNFVDSFEDNYTCCDPHLAYFTASPREVKIESKKVKNETMYLSVIDDVDKNLFVACTVKNFNYIGRPSSEIRVYKHTNAPNVMQDWTVGSVSILATTHHISSDISQQDESFIKAHLESSNVLETFGTSATEVLDSIRSAYQNRAPYKNEQSDTPSEIRTPDEDWGAVRYSLLIEFEENNNIVWHTYLCELEDEVYFECYLYEGETLKREYARLDDDFATTVRQLIDDYSKA